MARASATTHARGCRKGSFSYAAARILFMVVFCAVYGTFTYG